MAHPLKPGSDLTDEEYATRFIGDGSEISFEDDPDYEEKHAKLLAITAGRERRIQELIAKHGAEWDKALAKR